MNKYQLYKQIRQELAVGCDKELKAVAELLECGLTSIGGGGVALDVGTPNTLNSMSEAGRIFREELSDAVRLILERYRRNLQKEVAGLGLQEVRAEVPPAENYSGRSIPLDIDRIVNSAERLARPADGVLTAATGKPRIQEARS